MPTYPTGTNFENFLTHTNAQLDGQGIVHSQSLSGGYQEVNSIAERNAIPVMPDQAGTIYNGFTTAGDGGWTSGRRKVGMMVYCLDVNKLYILKPVGYFGNAGAGDETAWLALPEPERAVRIFPTGQFTDGTSAPPPPLISTYTDATSIGIAADANSCWVELELGGDNIYTSNLAGSLTMTEDVGGMPTGTTVADLTEIKSYDQLFDTILFPTSYPTMTQPSVALTPDGGLKIIGTDLANSFTLTTAANQGNWKLNGVTQGVLAGDVTAASITGPEGPFTLAVTAPNGIANQLVANHVVTEGPNSWTLTATFAAGPVPADSTGTPYPSGQFTGGNKTNGAAFEGVYPYFLGTDQNGFQQAGLRSHSTGTSVTNNNLIIQADQGYQEVNGSLHHRISISDAHIAGRTVQVWVYSPVSTQYSDASANWVTSAETRTIAGVNGVPYTTLTKSESAGGSNLYRIKFV
jgi:hypothetical protein|tara:strand:- start:81 stop:1469 length:1389 start_codon:yes stop_codon:yes gene_type:complete